MFICVSIIRYFRSLNRIIPDSENLCMVFNLFPIFRGNPVPVVGSQSMLSRAARREPLQRGEAHIYRHLQYLHSQFTDDCFSVSI